MTHRDGFPRFSARSVRCGDAVHLEACATLPESLGKLPFGSRMRPVGGRRNGLTMHTASTAPLLLPEGPHTRSPWVISNAHWYYSLVGARDGGPPRGSSGSGAEPGGDWA